MIQLIQAVIFTLVWLLLRGTPLDVLLWLLMVAQLAFLLTAVALLDGPYAEERDDTFMFISVVVLIAEFFLCVQASHKGRTQNAEPGHH